ncbi:hypothetical protein ADIARSV_0198 [Arcticibacter svalbardensis MN12-7]|uniref:DUF3037 domain-containing protein n=1 Tax=Arcticibacter svalbardensis MN12-7 TaxID=1150600 RepID=R9GXM8_9SPHI|nr:DUF3037 domain-containing protein [Arcticibacter svalbardensis]EOR96567.1 hypothetical protein ADIARSV_0198 [Arcticibacter svalbardensis MN12-7]
MQGKYLFEYAVIRLVPRVEREEFVNIGVILFCSAQKFLDMNFILNEERIRSFSSDTDILEIYNNLQAYKCICSGSKDGGVIGQLVIAERFRWLTATRSTVVQSSKVHPGFCGDAAETLEHLYNQLVV